MSVYYNENDPFCCAWLRALIDGGLIAKGVVDARSICEVSPEDLAGFEQCHFFAGLGGWPRALELAGWGARPVWTASPPCQPFSHAGARRGHGDERHLWPALSALIRERKPPILFGEQVAKAIKFGWLDAVAADLEDANYAFGAAILPACAVAAPHERPRIFFVADADRERWRQRRQPQRQPEQQSASWDLADRRGEDVPDAGGSGLPLPQQTELPAAPRQQEGGAAQQLHRWAPEPNVGRVAHGIPGRVGQLRALGNAIVPQIAATFVQAVME